MSGRVGLAANRGPCARGRSTAAGKRDPLERTPLHEACVAASDKVVRTLIDRADAAGYLGGKSEATPLQPKQGEGGDALAGNRDLCLASCDATALCWAHI